MQAQPVNIAIGFFDGVHAGHRGILSHAEAALTFRAHPLSILAPERAPKLLMAPDERLAAIAAALAEGPREVKVLEFTRELAAEPPSAFAARLRRLFPCIGTVFCGPNWTYGAGGKGTAETLRADGIDAVTVPFALCGGAPISSTRIRESLAGGDLASAAAMLGRPYSMRGRTVPGKGAGRRLGFPTVNVQPEAEPPLARGAYAVDTVLGPGVANWGTAPTFGADAWSAPMLEVHLMRAPDGVPPMIDVGFRRFLRAERKFSSENALRQQLAVDAEQAFSEMRKGDCSK